MNAVKPLLICLLVLLNMGCSNTSSDVQSAKVTNVSTTLNIREKPDGESPVVQKIANDERIVILGTKDGWAHIRHGSITGYVKDSYIIPLKTNEDSDESWLAGIWTYLQNTEVGGIIKIVGGILLVIIVIGLVAVIIAGISVIVGILLNIIGVGLGGGLLGLAIGYFVYNGNSDMAVEWMKWGFYIGCGIGILIALVHPIEAASDGMKSLTSLTSGSSPSGSSNKRSSTPVQIYDHPSGDSYYHDEDGNLHWLRKEENGYREIGGTGFFDENGYNKGQD